MMQRTANEYAACERRICKRSDQPKINRITNNDARLILSALHHCLLKKNTGMSRSKARDYNLGQNKLEHLDHPSPPFQCCQDGALLLLRAFIIALGGGGGWGIIVLFYAVQDCNCRLDIVKKSVFIAVN